MIRDRATGEILNEGDFRRMHSSVPLPFILTQELVEPLNADLVLDAPTPITGEYEYVVVEGAYQNTTDGKWYKNYVIKPVFTEFTDETGVVHTVEMQIEEAKFNAANCNCPECQPQTQQ